MSGEQITNMNHKDAREVIDKLKEDVIGNLDRIQECFIACEGIEDPILTLQQARELLDDLFYVWPEADETIGLLKLLREDLGK